MPKAVHGLLIARQVIKITPRFKFHRREIIYANKVCNPTSGQKAIITPVQNERDNLMGQASLLTSRTKNA